MNENILDEKFRYAKKWFGKQVTKGEALDLCAKEDIFYDYDILKKTLCTKKGHYDGYNYDIWYGKEKYKLSELEENYYYERLKFHNNQFVFTERKDFENCLSYYKNKGDVWKRTMKDTSFFYDENNNVIAQSSSNFSRAKYLINKEYYNKLEQKVEEKKELIRQRIEKREKEYEEQQRRNKSEKKSEVIWWQLPSEYL